MTFNDEEDYIMRIIKEMVRVLFLSYARKTIQIGRTAGRKQV